MDTQKNSITESHVGVLRTNMVLKLHTQYANKLWNGSKKEGQVKIISMPACLNIISRIHQNSAQDDPYADDYLLQVEQQITFAREFISKRVNQIFDAYVDKIPEGIELIGSFNIKPIEIPIVINSHLGYQLVYLLSDYDAYVRSIMTAAHIAVIPRGQSHDLIEEASKLVRQTYGLIQRYKFSGVTREDFKQQNPKAASAVERLGQLKTEILDGSLRSQYAPFNANLVTNTN